MTYFGFLAIFLFTPLLVLGFVVYSDRQRGIFVIDELESWPLSRVMLVNILLALVYTTPWDNYLVATSVWWYNPALVTGITIGWVPIEEYTFFILQTLLVVAWLGILLRRTTKDRSSQKYLPQKSDRRIRWISSLSLLPIWLFSIISLSMGVQPLTYLALILAWALPPIMLQLSFGADILWRYRKPVGLTIISATLYLALADSLAIKAGTWVISPQQTVNLYLGGVLPIEEFTFFLMTNILVVFSSILILARESRDRLPRFLVDQRNRPGSPSRQTNSSP